jgi:hypothetical protein
MPTEENIMDTLNPNHPDFSKHKFVRNLYESVAFDTGLLIGALSLYLTVRYNLWPIYVIFLAGFGLTGVDFLIGSYRYYLSINGESKYL